MYGHLKSSGLLLAIRLPPAYVSAASGRDQPAQRVFKRCGGNRRENLVIGQAQNLFALHAHVCHRNRTEVGHIIRQGTIGCFCLRKQLPHLSTVLKSPPPVGLLNQKLALAPRRRRCSSARPSVVGRRLFVVWLPRTVLESIKHLLHHWQRGFREAVMPLRLQSAIRSICGL